MFTSLKYREISSLFLYDVPQFLRVFWLWIRVKNGIFSEMRRKKKILFPFKSFFQIISSNYKSIVNRRDFKFIFIRPFNFEQILFASYSLQITNEFLTIFENLVFFWWYFFTDSKINEAYDIFTNLCLWEWARQHCQVSLGARECRHKNRLRNFSQYWRCRIGPIWLNPVEIKEETMVTSSKYDSIVAWTFSGFFQALNLY